MTTEQEPRFGVRFRCHRSQTLDAGQKLVTRSSRWGNPFPVGSAQDVPGQSGSVSLSAAAAVELYRCYLKQRLEEEPGWLDPLIGFDLGCYCLIGEVCHADLLVATCNAGLAERYNVKIVLDDLQRRRSEALGVVTEAMAHPALIYTGVLERAAQVLKGEL